MLRRTIARNGSRRPSPFGQENKPNNPFETQGNMGQSFEKIQDLMRKRPMEVTENMYDRVGPQSYSTNPGAADFMPGKGKGMDAEPGGGAAGAQGMQSWRHDLQKHEPADVAARTSEDGKTVSKDLPFERIYTAKPLAESKLSPEYYYPAPPTKEQMANRRVFYLRASAMTVTLLTVLWVMWMLSLDDPLHNAHLSQKDIIDQEVDKELKRQRQWRQAEEEERMLQRLRDREVSASEAAAAAAATARPSA